MTKQLNLFDQPKPAATFRLDNSCSMPVTAATHQSRKPDIDLVKIQADLQEDAGSVKIKVVRGNGDNTRVSIHETDKMIHIRINPKKIKTQGQLDKVLHWCHESINWDYKA